MIKKKSNLTDSSKIDNSKNVGSSETQIGSLSEKINNLSKHFGRF